jgi:hypothetical protein
MVGEPIGPGQDGSALFLMGRFDGGGSGQVDGGLMLGFLLARAGSSFGLAMMRTMPSHH